ncbi:MAG: NifU family protein [Proteobacteria bacterium]|nr:NifU family protein [Pseudomonadota bacterium]
MFIQTEDTPNPAALKFLPGRTVMETGSVHYDSLEVAEASPLARRLFAVDGVSQVFFGADFISVTKTPDYEWFTIKPGVLAAIMEHYASGMPVVEKHAGADEGAGDGEDSEVVAQIKHLLDTRVRPAVAMDGGDIVFKSFDEGVVTLRMQGACQGCPSSTATLKMGIENMLRHYIPDVREVRADEEG